MTTQTNPSLPTRPARIVIVDDHPNTAPMLARALGEFSSPVEIITARSGQEALELINEGVVDVLITDFMMPGMNGLELIEKLQGGSKPGHTILITAYDSPGLALSARRLKINDYLVKPVQPETIRNLVSRALDSLRMLQQPLANVTSTSPFKILIADDNPDNVHLLIARLESEGYGFITAGDGDETLDQARVEQPDLILLDVNMPRKDGFAVLTEMRADPELAHIPVIMLTAARTTIRDIREGLGLGADDYVTKPFDWRELAARVRAKLRVKKAEDALRRRNRELGLLPEIGQDLSARLDVDELATVTLKRSVSALGAAAGHILIFQPTGNPLHKVYVVRGSSPWPDLDAQKRLSAAGIASQVITNRQSYIVEDSEADQYWHAEPGQPPLAAVSVPLFSRSGIMGSLTLTHENKGFFNADHVVLLQAIASQATLAIENIQLYATEHRRGNELLALNQLTREISLLTYSDELFNRVPELIQTLMGYPLVSLWLNENNTVTLRRLASKIDNPPATQLLSRAPLEAMVVGHPVQHAGSDVQPAAVAVPLFWNSRVGGVLAVHHPQPESFQESDWVLLETLGAQFITAYERVRLFESVEQEGRRLAAILRAAAEAILVFDTNHLLLLLNPAAQRLFASNRILPGEPLPSGVGYDTLLKVLAEARDTGSAAQGEVTWPDKRTFAVMVTPIEDGGQVVVLHDVTHFKELNRVKTEFIATASHDLKNPITSILGYSDLLGKAGPLTPMQTDCAQRIARSAQQMNELVQALLELARIDMGIELKCEEIGVADLLTSVADEFTRQAAAKQQTLQVTPPEAGLKFTADVLRIRQVLRNLINNALKYTPEKGRLTLTALPEGKRVRVKISDTGAGIPAADLPFIFDKFYRVQNEATLSVEGNGLGLSIVKSIIEQHGGQVAVESVEGQGSTFSFTLPVSA